jgi:predicted nucleic acid-binding protein
MANVLIDSNVWIYSFLQSNENERNRQKALTLIEELKDSGKIFVSTQVINEFHWVLKRKYGVDEKEIKDRVLNGIAKITEVTPITEDFYEKAFQIRGKYDISFWDSYIVTSALEHDCTKLYTEDMKHNLLVEAKLKIINPFL